ncbi:hypothetical protein OQA88_1001 [Cercophora sp. LCS_1]
MDSPRHLPAISPESPLLPLGDTESYLHAALEDIISNYPPRSRYPHEVLQGLSSGPTGIAYLLLQVSHHRPELVISGRPAAEWATAYMSGSRGHNLRLGSHGCGVSDEKLAFEAVRAAVTKSPQHVREFISSAAQVVAVEEFPDENLYGRAGTLYLLRLVRKWTGDNKLVDALVAEISNAIMNRGPEWKWHGNRYLGAAHGDVGIITQLVLTSPELAERVEPWLERVIQMQGRDGNWPGSEGSGHGGKGLVQFCHGAPGFIISLLSLREHFPNLGQKIDDAVRRGRECVWNEGLLKKEPNLCHGIFGNAL